MITYPVLASGDGTERIVDAAGHVLGTVEIVAALDAMHALLGRLNHRYHVAGEPLWDEVGALLGHGHEHGHAGELSEGQIDLIRRLQWRVEALESVVCPKPSSVVRCEPDDPYREVGMDQPHLRRS